MKVGTEVPAKCRQAFTLVELLIVGAVIAILATLTLVAVNMVAVTAKITKARSTIQKLDVAMQQIFETYEEKLSFIRKQIAANDETKNLDKKLQQKIAAHYIRDLMRMEMPQNWAEVQTEPLEMTEGYAVGDSPLRKYYLQEESKKPVVELNSAELLFLIVQNLNPEALEAFHGSEVADTNGNGFLEFVDAWGKPIRFLRWAPAFPGSDMQYDVLKASGGLPQTKLEDNKNWWLGRETAELLYAMRKATWRHHDPTDERIPSLFDDLVRQHSGESEQAYLTDEKAPIGWFLYPLIYSAGPDGDYGLDEGDNAPPVLGTEDILDPFAVPRGMPYGSSHFDNIHNHRWYNSF